MTLSQRAEKAREALFGRYDQLNSLWMRAQEELTKLHIPRPVSYSYRSYKEDYYDPSTQVDFCLGIQKIKGKWGICHAIDHPCDGDYDPEWTPIAECSVEVRVQAAKYVPQLKEAVVKSAETFIATVDEAIGELNNALSLPDEHLQALLAERAKLNGRAK